MKFFFALVGVAVLAAGGLTLWTPAVNAKSEEARCEYKISEVEGGRTGLIVCEVGKELPAKVKELIPESLWQVEPPGGEGAALMGGGSNIALFHCGNGDPCSANGWGYGGIRTDWYRYNNIHMGFDYEVCWQPQGCPFYTFYWPDSGHRGNYVTSSYTNYITTCWCDGGWCEMP